MASTSVLSIEDKGKKLGLLIASLNVSNSTKQAFLDLLPHASAEQLDTLSEYLEKSLLNQLTDDVDKEFALKLAAIDEEYDKEVRTILKKTQDDFTALKKSASGV